MGSGVNAVGSQGAAPALPTLRGGNSSANQAANQGVEVAWTDWVIEQLGVMGGYATSQQLVDAARRDERMRERFLRTPNGYYNGVARVKGRKQIRQVGRLYALPGVEVPDPEKGEASPKGGSLFN